MEDEFIGRQKRQESAYISTLGGFTVELAPLPGGAKEVTTTTGKDTTQLESPPEARSPPSSSLLEQLDEQMVQEVLESRPTLQLGRHCSMRQSRSAFTRRRNKVSHSSLPYRSHSAVTRKSKLVGE